MGLYLLLFNQKEWDRLFNSTDCGLEPEPRTLFTKVLAATEMCVCVISEILYIPCLYAMSQKDMRRSFCYKLMLLISIFDVIGLPTSGFITGWFSWNGYTHLTHPLISFLDGTLIFSLWIGYATSTIILALNRCLLMSRYSFIFKGALRQWFWLMLGPVITVLGIFFGQNLVWNGIYDSWHFNPYLGCPEAHVNEREYTSYLIGLNIPFSVAFPAIYLMFFLKYHSLSRKRIHGMCRKEAQLFIQTLVVTSTVTVSASFYCLVQYVPAVSFLAPICHFWWVLTEAAPPIIYLTMNDSIQRTIISIWKKPEAQPNSYELRNGSTIRTDLPTTSRSPSSVFFPRERSFAFY